MRGDKVRGIDTASCRFPWCNLEQALEVSLATIPGFIILSAGLVRYARGNLSDSRKLVRDQLFHILGRSTPVITQPRGNQVFLTPGSSRRLAGTGEYSEGMVCYSGFSTVPG